MVLAFSLALAALIAPPPSPASAPLRHTVYSIQGVVDSNVTTTSSNGDLGETPSIHNAKRDTPSGTVSVDVLQALPDHSLVVRMTEQTPSRHGAPLTFGIAGDGALVLDGPTADALSPEQIAIARILSTQLVAGHALAAGAAWELQRHSPDDDDTHVSVTALDGKDAHLSIAETETGKSASSHSEKYSYDVTYDVTKTLPVSMTVDGTLSDTTSAQRYWMQLRLTVQLVSDSMGAS